MDAQTYIDSEGVSFLAVQFTGVSILNLGGAEVCVNAGDWIAYLPDGGARVVTDEVFKASFIKSE